MPKSSILCFIGYLQFICVKHELGMWLSPIQLFVNGCSIWSIVETITRFETWITRNDVNGVSLFHLPYLITLMTYLCSQWTPNVQINLFMLHWSIYELFVLTTGWTRESIQLNIFVNVCSTWKLVELITFWEANNTKWRKWCTFDSPV
jgi:hypothetical protein